MTLLQNKLKIKLINIQKRISKPQMDAFGVLFFNANSLAVRFLFGVIFLVQVGFANGRLEFNDNLKKAYKNIAQLKIEAGQTMVEKAKMDDPTNMMTYYIENYIDFFVLFIQENKGEYKVRLKNKEKRLEKIQSADSSTPYYLFCQAEIMLQWATIKMKFNDKIGAASDVYSAYNLLEENKRLFPSFKENDKSLSVIHALAESLPYWVRKSFGIHGSIELATKEISGLASYAAKTDHIFKEEIIAIYSYILFYSNNKKEEAFALFQLYNLDYTKSPLVAFLMATMAQKTGRNDLAIKILEQRPSSGEYLPFYYLDFMLGKFKLYRLDTDAEKHILKFINNFKGQHYIKEAYQKLAWSRWILNKDAKGFRAYASMCATKGQNLIDEDKQAELETKVNELPNEYLLKARLLYDGGYYTKAQQLLIIHASRLNSENVMSKSEFTYRMGRVSDALKNYHDAMDYYLQTIKTGTSQTYFPCAASIYLAAIYENQNQLSKAKEYYNIALTFHPKGYANSLHQKAKSGIERVSKGK